MFEEIDGRPGISYGLAVISVTTPPMLRIPAGKEPSPADNFLQKQRKQRSLIRKKPIGPYCLRIPRPAKPLTVFSMTFQDDRNSSSHDPAEPPSILQWSDNVKNPSKSSFLARA